MDTALFHESLQEFHKWLSAEETALQVQAESPEEFFANNQTLLSIIDTLPNGFTILTPDLTRHILSRTVTHVSIMTSCSMALSS